MKAVDSATERTTAATDLLLALIGGCGAALLQWGAPEGSWRADLWSGVFGLVAFSALLGALAHGFDLAPRVHGVLWQGINLGLGLAVSLFAVGVAGDLAGPGAAQRMLWPMLAAGIGFYLMSRRFTGRFGVFVLYQAAASVCALAAYGWLALAAGRPGAGLMALGVLAGLVAGWLQTRKGVTLDIGWTFDHNGLFHLVQAGSLLLLLAGLAVSPFPF